MKFRRILFAAIALLVASSLPAAAQSAEAPHQSVPGKGSFMMEMNLLPGSKDIIDFHNIQLRYRISDRIGLRGGFEWDKHKNSMSPPKDYDPIIGVISISEKTSMWGIGLGAEYRLLPHSRISPYVGFDLKYSERSSKAKYTDYYSFSMNGEADITETSVNGVWRTKTEVLIIDWGGATYTSSTVFDKYRAYRNYRADLLLGVDIHLIKHLYIGLEMKFGLSNFVYKPCTADLEKNIYSDYSNGVLHSTINFQERLPKNSNFELGFSSIKGIKLGFWF